MVAPSVLTSVLALLLVNSGAEGAWTPLHRAVRRGTANDIRRLLREDDTEPNARGPRGVTPLMLAASVRPEMVGPLLEPAEIIFTWRENAVDVNRVDDDGRDAVIHAIRAGNYAVATRLVVDHSAGLAAVDRTGRSAFDYAAQKDTFTSTDRGRLTFLAQAMWYRPAFHGWGATGTQRPPTVKELAGELCARKVTVWDIRARLAMAFASDRAEPSLADKRELVLCAAKAGIDLGSLDVASAFHLRGDLEIVDERGYPPRLIMLLDGGVARPGADLSEDVADAVERGFDDAALRVLELMNGRHGSRLGRALTTAAQRGNASLVKALLAAGAPVEGSLRPDSSGRTPLALAAATECEECVKALLAANASLYPGMYPFEGSLVQRASEKNRPQIEAAIKARGPDPANLAEDERGAADAAFTVIRQKLDRSKGWSFSVRHVLFEKQDPVEPGMVPSTNIEGFLWDSPTSVHIIARTVEIDTRPHDYPQLDGYGSSVELFLEKSGQRWIVKVSRDAPWVE
jgi:ankyrin repeat protein